MNVSQTWSRKRKFCENRFSASLTLLEEVTDFHPYFPYLFTDLSELGHVKPLRSLSFREKNVAVKVYFSQGRKLNFSVFHIFETFGYY
jgi:hypothetical protein